jgi:hypothetical protein
LWGDAAREGPVQADGHEQARQGGLVLAHDGEGRPMNGWLMWGLILPLLLVVAGIITIRRRNHRP